MSLSPRRLAIVACAMLIFTGGVHGAAAQSRVPQWTKAAPFPTPEEELYGSVVNGKFYVLGGFGMGGMAPGMVFEYDPASEILVTTGATRVRAAGGGPRRPPGGPAGC